MKNDPPKNGGESLLAEAEFAKKLGLDPQLVAEVRARALDPDDWIGELGTVLYRPSGVRKALAALQAPPATEYDVVKKDSGPVTLYVFRKFRNVKILEATPDRLHEKKAVRVRVPDSGRFCLGAPVPAVPAEDGGWRLHGRAPRKTVRPASL